MLWATAGYCCIYTVCYTSHCRVYIYDLVAVYTSTRQFRIYTITMRLCCVHTQFTGDQLDPFDRLAVYTHAGGVGVFLYIREDQLSWAYLIDPELVRLERQDMFD